MFLMKVLVLSKQGTSASEELEHMATFVMQGEWHFSTTNNSCRLLKKRCEARPAVKHKVVIFIF